MCHKAHVVPDNNKMKNRSKSTNSFFILLVHNVSVQQEENEEKIRFHVHCTTHIHTHTHRLCDIKRLEIYENW